MEQGDIAFAVDGVQDRSIQPRNKARDGIYTSESISILRLEELASLHLHC